ncbi:hypothetical protein Vi05172_g716 [Venturia inaequalis]|nr:hypothetical protein Vi05172_g716 [Venturia inaequalis]
MRFWRAYAREAFDLKPTNSKVFLVLMAMPWLWTLRQRNICCLLLVIRAKIRLWPSAFRSTRRRNEESNDC